MEIDEKTLKKLVEDGRVSDPELRVMDSGMNVSLVMKVDGAGKATLHTKRGGARIMSPQTGLRFADTVLGAETIRVVLKNERK